MAAGTYNIVIDQGSDFALDLVVKVNGVVKDLTLYSARAHLRASKDPSAALTASFDCTISDAVNGVMQMAMTNAATAAIAKGIYYYDLEIYTSADASVTRLLHGKAEVRQEITR